MKLTLPDHIAERLKMLAVRRSRESGRKVTPQALARIVLAEHVNARLKVCVDA